MALRCGRYETLRVIASGGMATVHLARALGAGGFERLVAIKVMHPHIAREPEFVDMFLDEGRLAASIHHPNVVGTIDVQRDEGGLFIVMDYVEGAALQLIWRELWAQGQTIPLPITLRIFLDVLAGLHAAHELCGADGEPLYLVHRDVSPQNILVGVDGVARLTDFGVARARSRLASTQGGQLKGKLTYMAPEQVRAEAVDRRTDIYAAGVVLWEMLAGRRLNRADNDAAVVQCIMDGVSKSPRDVLATVPEPISMVCMRALGFEPEDRYPTASAFAEALETAAQEAGVMIATPLRVSGFMKAQSAVLEHHEERAARPDAITVPASDRSTKTAPVSDRPTLKERITPLFGIGQEAAPNSGTQWAPNAAIVAPSSTPLSSEQANREPRMRHPGRSVAVSAGVFAIMAVVGWLLASRQGDQPRALAPLLTASAPIVPVEPPSVVEAPPATTPSESPQKGPQAGSPKEKSGEPSWKPDATKPLPSPTSFRPSEL